MEKLSTFLILFSILLISATHATSRKREAIESAEARADRWFKKFSQQKVKVAKLHFYVQETESGPNATIWEIARSEITSRSPTMFGQVQVVDDLVTVGPDRNSTALGRAQGFITSSDLQEPALTMNFNFVFTAGEYNGSTLCILGRNPFLTKDRELPVVGGTRIFRMARGFSISNIYSYNPPDIYAVVEYTVYVSYIEAF